MGLFMCIRNCTHCRSSSFTQVARNPVRLRVTRAYTRFIAPGTRDPEIRIPTLKVTRDAGLLDYYSFI